MGIGHASLYMKYNLKLQRYFLNYIPFIAPTRRSIINDVYRMWACIYPDKPRASLYIGEQTIKITIFSFLKGTVSVISSDTPDKDGNARFTTVTLKALSVQVWMCINVYNFENWLLITVVSLQKKPRIKHFVTHWLDKVFNGTIVNQALSSLHWGFY